MRTVLIFFLILVFCSFAKTALGQYSFPDSIQRKGNQEKAEYLFAIYGDYFYEDSSVVLAKKGLEYAMKCDCPETQISGYLSLGYAYYLLQNFESAAEQVELGKVIAKRTNNYRQLFKSNSMLGAIHDDMKESDLALMYYKDALWVSNEQDEPSWKAECYHNLGTLLMGNKIVDFEKCRKYFRLALKNYDLAGVDESEKYETYVSLALIGEDENEIDTYLKKAYELHMNESVYVPLRYFQLNKGFAYEQAGITDKALDAFLEAIRLCENAEDTNALKVALGQAGMTCTTLQRDQLAITYLNRALAYEQPDSDKQAYYEKLAELYARQKDYKNAYLYLELFRVLSDSINKTAKEASILEFDSKFSAAEKEKKIAEQQLDLSEKALEVAEEKSKSRTILLFGVALLFLAIGIYQWFLFRQKKKKTETDIALKKEQEFNQLRTIFLENIAHEIRTPITLINGHLDLILDRNEQTDADKQDLKLALSSSKRVLTNANELLELLKFEKGLLKLNIVDIQLLNFLKRIFLSFESLAGAKKIALTFDCSIAEDFMVQMDGKRVEKILNNLISNAIKFSPSNTQITLSANCNNALLTIFVEDNGPGIEYNEQKKIFDRFYQSSSTPQIGGVGIGLSLAREFAQSMDGSLTVESTPGGGSTFCLSLPVTPIVSKASTVQSDLVNQEDQSASMLPDFLEENKKPAILIVEDNIEMNQFLHRILSDHYNCHCCFDGVEALQAVQKNTFDLIISDVMMPKMDGFEFREKLLKLEKQTFIPFIFLTAKDYLDDKLKGFNMAIDDYITKPFVKSELLARIHNILEKKLQRDKHQKDQLNFLDKNNLSAKDQLLELIQRTIIENISNEEFKVTDLAREVGYSPRQLSRILQKMIGLSPVQYILEIRLQRAYKALIEKEFFTLSEVRYHVGIASRPYFNEKFKGRFGMLPSELFEQE